MRRKCFGRTWAWNVAWCAPRRPCYRGPSVVATRHDCQGSLLEAGAISSGLIRHDLRLTCQSFLHACWPEPPHLPHFSQSHRPRGTARSRRDVWSEAERRITRFRSEIFFLKKGGKIRNEIDCDIQEGNLVESRLETALFTF